MRTAILIIVWLFISIIFFYSQDKKEHQIDKIGLEDLNLNLIGVIKSVDEGENFHGYGIITVEILKSNIKEYDPRQNQQFYFCIIKNGIAEIYDHAVGRKIGDTLIYDTKNKLGGYLRNGKKEDYGTISINSDDGYWDYIRKHQKL